ncbi:MAG TPA: hypothetical protein VHE30_18445 [Polyangiaceae bacterium]|nr:hypothetical protein [Polyangiaceae bacterium]
MEVPDRFKLDVRVRDRMLANQTVTPADVQKHLDALPDLEASAEVIDLAQPAVSPPGERPPPSARPAPRPVAAVAPAAPMSVAPPPLPVDEGWGDEDDDLDDEDDDEDDDDDETEGGAGGEGPKEDGATE